MKFNFRAFRVFQYDYAPASYVGRANVLDDNGNYLNIDLDSNIHRTNRNDALNDAKQLAKEFELQNQV